MLQPFLKRLDAQLIKRLVIDGKIGPKGISATVPEPEERGFDTKVVLGIFAVEQVAYCVYALLLFRECKLIRRTLWGP